MSNNDGAGFTFVILILIGLGIYEFATSESLTLRYEGVLEDAGEEEVLSYFGAIKFNVEAGQGKVFTLSGLNGVMRELDDCSIFDKDNWSCADYYIGERVGKTRGTWITPEWIRPITLDLEWLYIKYLRPIIEDEPVSLIFTETRFEPRLEIYTPSEQSVLQRSSLTRERLNETWAVISDENGLAEVSDEKLQEFGDLLNESILLENEIVLGSPSVTRLPLADSQDYGWRISLPTDIPSGTITRTEQTNDANSQLCVLNTEPESYCVFNSLAQIAADEGVASYLFDSYITALSDPAGSYNYRVFVDGMYQGEAEIEFYEP